MGLTAPFPNGTVPLDISGSGDASVAAAPGTFIEATLGANSLTLNFPAAADYPGQCIGALRADAPAGATPGAVLVSGFNAMQKHNQSRIWRSDGTAWRVIAQGSSFARSSAIVWEVLAVADLPTGGDVCTVADTLAYGTLRLTQTTAGQTVTLPAPGDVNPAGKTMRLALAAGSVPVTAYGVALAGGDVQEYEYNGSTWKPIGAAPAAAALAAAVAAQASADDAQSDATTALANAASAQSTANAALPKAGGTMSGQITLAGGGAGADAISKDEVQSLINAAPADVATWSIAKASTALVDADVAGLSRTDGHGNVIRPDTGDLLQCNDGVQFRLSNDTYGTLANWVTVTVVSTTFISEGTGLYFTTARVLATALTGLSVATGGDVVATDTVLVAFGRVQKTLTDLAALVALKAPLLSPALTGTPTVPTAAPGTDTTQAASTAFANAAALAAPIANQRGRALTSGSTMTANGGVYLSDTSGGVFGTAPKFPASPTVGDILSVFDYTGSTATNALTLDGNGKNIVGVNGDGVTAFSATTFTIGSATSAYSRFDFIYNGTAWAVPSVLSSN